MCQICIDEPGSHSFEYIGKTCDDILIYYTRPGKATKYWDTKGILERYEEVLENNNNQKWIWRFDGDGFDLKHSLEIATAIGLIGILIKYSDSLCEIQIINPTIYIRSLYGMIYPFLTPELVDKINWL